ncbi:MAG TPA: sigma-70 family RNA polymerase sigma factor [Ruminococcaceae bacterium]|jgi:RNA polymerase sigma factor (sigma-70 family)|nr:sigma-70 family RNA polymerase sigma factor [Oscillospiraceae bacterium]
MSEGKKYTIFVKHQRVEVRKAVYHAYHKAREAERYQDKVSRQFELSLERFQEDGVQVELQLSIYQPTVEDRLIQQERLQKLEQALAVLDSEEKLLIHELFYNGKSERVLALETDVPNMTIHDRKQRILKKLRKIIES